MSDEEKVRDLIESAYCRPVAQVRAPRPTIDAEEILRIVEEENRSCRRQIAVLEEALRNARNWLWVLGVYALAATALLLGFFLRVR